MPSVMIAESQRGGGQAGPRGAAPPHLPGGTSRHPGLRSLRQWAPGAGIWLRLSITSVCVCAISWVTELTRELTMEFVFVHCKCCNFRTSCIKYERCIYNGACVLP